MSLCGLERMGTVLNLAASLWYARASLYGLDVPHFNALDVLVKHRFVELAADILEQLKPTDAPAWPDGLFQQAAEGARAEGRRVLAFRGLDTSDGRD